MLNLLVVTIARTIADLETALNSRTQEANRASAEARRLAAKTIQLEELTRRQALMIKNLVNGSRGDDLAAELATLQIENAHLRKRLEAQPAPEHAS